MDKVKVETVLNGFRRLADDERTEFIRQLNEILGAPPDLRKARYDGIEKRGHEIFFGPLPSRCTCCGR